MAIVRNQSAPHVDRIQRKVERASTRSPMRHGAMTGGTFTVTGDARFIFDEGNIPDIPNATPTRTGLMPAGDKAKLDSMPAMQVDSTLGTRVTIGGQVISYDSGWRDLAQFLGTNAAPGSFLHIRRTLDLLHLRGQVAFTSDSGSGVIAALPNAQGWRPFIAASSGGHGAMIVSHAVSTIHYLRMNPTGGLAYITNSTGNTWSDTRPTEDLVTISAALTAPPELPVTLIGTPA